MTVAQLIAELAALDPNLTVLLTVADDAGITAHGNVTSVTVEDDHGTEELFVRISGDSEED